MPVETFLCYGERERENMCELPAEEWTWAKDLRACGLSCDPTVAT